MLDWCISTSAMHIDPVSRVSLLLPHPHSIILVYLLVNLILHHLRAGSQAALAVFNLPRFISLQCISQVFSFSMGTQIWLSYSCESLLFFEMGSHHVS